MEINQLYESLQHVRTLAGPHLPVAIQVNEDEVFLLERASVIYRTDESGGRTAHVLVLKPIAFRLYGGLPCAHIDASRLTPNTTYTSTFCPDCGAKLDRSKDGAVIEGERGTS